MSKASGLPPTNWLQRRTPGEFRRWLRVEVGEGEQLPAGTWFACRFWLYRRLCDAKGWAIRWNLWRYRHWSPP